MTAAAGALHTNVATVSRRIERASEKIGAAVFQKEGGVWKPTATGLRFIKIAEDFEAEVLREENNADHGDGAAPAHITLLAPPVILSSVLLPALGALVADRPNLSVTLQNKVVAEGLGDSDLFLRWGRPQTGRLVARQIAKVKFRPYCGRRIRHPDWVSLEQKHDDAPPAQLGRAAFGKPPRIRTAHVDHKVLLMKNLGYGGILPELLGDRDPDLIRHPDHPGASDVMELWYCFHSSRRDDVTLRHVVQWVTRAFDTEARPEAIVLSDTPELSVG